MNFDPRETQSLVEEQRRSAIVIGLRRVSNGEVVRLDGKQWAVGTNPACEIVVSDPFVSAKHCAIERRGQGALVVRDLESRNGTFIEGNRVESAELRVGSFLAVGHTTFVAVAAIEDEHRRAAELLRGQDPALRTTIDQAKRAAIADCNVLILGETGTGKDLLARLIHESSRRKSGPFVAVNCGALPRELIASHLFGHEKGAFTGAVEQRDGYFVEASGGTLFLDEIGELPVELQPHLLRVLETKRVRRLSGGGERSVDVRIVAATNQTAGLGGDHARLRSDLYHRLAVIELHLAPLRERMSDLSELVETFLAEHEAEHGRKEVTPDGWDALLAHDWPGNIRELRASVSRAAMFGHDQLGPKDFFPSTPGRGRQMTRVDTQEVPKLAPYHATLRVSMEQALVRYGTIRAAASAIGMPKSTFADKAKAWKLEVRRKVRINRPAKG
ncbi:MAG: sigma 54-interacting transcriptional regulator [Deltaproteobacteria bacterium]